ncbi:regulator of conidiation-1 [Colletotrichum filicis]|nr:regulator of conidiation-1 [Colletotrichum filicis]
MAGPEISQAARRCHDSLSSLAQEFETSRNTWEHELTERDFAQLLERFEQWAGNLGALRQPSSKLSLDHRLRDSPTVRASIFSMLEDLNESAKMGTFQFEVCFPNVNACFIATEIVSGRRPNRVVPTLDITDEELEEFDISSSSSESGASTTSNSTRDSRHGKPSEIQKLLSAIRTSLNSLFKASVFIRKFAPEDRRQRASKTKPFVNTADLMYIKDKYSILWETNEPLAIRLAEANARRRQYFKYRQQHQEKLASQQDDIIMGRRDAHLRAEPKPIDGEPLPQGSIVSAMTKPSILAETEATEFVRNKEPETQFFAIQSPEPAMSVFSMATTVVEASDTELQFPPIPQEGQKSDSFLCPYCLEIVLWQTKNKEVQWRQVYGARSVDIITDVHIHFENMSAIILYSFLSFLSHDFTQVVDIKSQTVVQTLVGHERNTVYKLDISKNGKLLASAGADSAVRLWSTTTWECSHVLLFSNIVTGVAFSNQNDFLVAFTYESNALVWKTDTTPKVGVLSEEGQPKPRIWECYGHTGGVNDARFSPDDKYVITASQDCSVNVFQAVNQQCDDSSQSLECLRKVKGHRDFVLALEVLPNGWVLSASGDGDVRFWDMTTGGLIARLLPHAALVRALAIGPTAGDRFRFATASNDDRWRVWSLSLTRPGDSMLQG